jgi:methionyl-tRNA formyltransferase
VLAIEPGAGLVVATGGCPVLVREAQLEGKRPAAGAQLLQQFGPAVGEHLG